MPITDSIQRRRIVITGVGIITPAGATLDQYWEKIISGTSALRTLSRVETPDLPFSIVGEVPDEYFGVEEQPGKFETVDRALLLCRCATRRALKDAGYESTPDKPLDIGISLGTGAGPTEATEDAYLSFAARGIRGLRPKTVTRLMFNSISAHVGIDFRLTGPQMTVTAACASANMAMSRAIDSIRYGRARAMMTGGTDMPICKTILSGWGAMRVCATSTDPNRCSLPFHAKRTGLVLSEGAAMFLFEELESAKARGAKIYAEVLGYGENNDGIHITQPDAASQARAIQEALADAGVAPEEVGYINAHGTGTALNDLSETEAIKAVFGARAPQIPISSTKSVLGHALGASGAVELPAILGAFKNKMVPPTANLDEVDPRCNLDYVPCEPRMAEVNVAISNSFAFGGSNSVLVLGRY